MFRRISVFLAVLLSAASLLLSSCAQAEETLARAEIDLLSPKGGITYVFKAERGDVNLTPSDDWEEIRGGMYEPGLWTFAVCGYDDDGNICEYGRVSVYLQSGISQTVTLSVHPYLTESGQSTVLFRITSADIDACHEVSLTLLKDSDVEDTLFLSSDLVGKSVTMNAQKVLEGGIYTVRASYFADDELYAEEVYVLKVPSSGEVLFEKTGRVRPSYVNVDFTDYRLDYGLSGDNSSKICIGFKRSGDSTDEILDMENPILSLKGKYWEDTQDLGIEPVLVEKTDTEALSSCTYLAVGSSVALSSCFLGNSAEEPNHSLKKAVVFCPLTINCLNYCSSLEKLCIREGSSSVGKSSFAHCPNLVFLFVSDTVTSFKQECFTGHNADIKIYMQHASEPSSSRWVSTWKGGIASSSFTWNVNLQQAQELYNQSI